ncbi:MAG: hypothetical protein NC111_04790 [Bacteroides sp.]|nr:hypothetical protein [Bacteroides sp.]MCM1413960.1 hypothetical protein [Bacteroides sp.]MCM1471823.1 hypothetical protein [Bacteroides sp.]
MNRKYIFLLPVLLLTLAVSMSCRGHMSSESVEETLRNAEGAVALGDVEAAVSAASYLFDDTVVKQSLTSQQMARLSMVYMYVADSDKDPELYTNRASDLYDMAYRTDADSAEAFYRNVDPGRLQYVETLSNHVANRANPTDMSNLPDEMEALDSLHTSN